MRTLSLLLLTSLTSLASAGAWADCGARTLSHAGRDYAVQVCHEPPIGADTPSARVMTTDTASGRTVVMDLRLDPRAVVERVSIDPGEYPLSDRHLSFGVRTETRRDTDGRTVAATDLHLVVLDGGRLRRVVSLNLDAASAATGCDGDCGDDRRSASTVVVSPRGNENMLDLIVGTRVQTFDADSGRMTMARERVRRLAWNGRTYVASR
jgi:hypothetical protein